MLTRKCQTILGLLLTEDDFNIRLTVAKNAVPTKRFMRRALIVSAWKECIKDSIGEILNSNEEYFIDILVVRGEHILKYENTLIGNEIINNFWYLILDADGIRVTVTEQNGKQSSYIIIRP